MHFGYDKLESDIKVFDMHKLYVLAFGLLNLILFFSFVAEICSETPLASYVHPQKQGEREEEGQH